MANTINLEKYTKTDKEGKKAGNSKTYITYTNDPTATEDHKKMLNSGYQKVIELRRANIDVERLVFAEILSKL